LDIKYINKSFIPRLNLIPLRNCCRRKVELLKVWWMVVGGDEKAFYAMAERKRGDLDEGC
jgi:hypothetical protein